MGGPHGHSLTYHGHSPLHRAPAHVKIVGTLLFVLAVVATPREAIWAFGIHLLVLVAAIAISRVPLRHIVVRLVVEVPFLVFAALMPFVAAGPRVEVGPLTLSEAGLWGAWALVAKGTLGAAASILLASTTEAPDLVSGLARLRLPATLVQILAFMVRYIEVVADQLRRMRIARESRAFRGRSVAAWPVIAGSAGALFIRSYERGERVHLAMLSRGYQGQAYLDEGGSVPLRTWTSALIPAAVAASVALIGMMTR